jgi:hypothetical protein
MQLNIKDSLSKMKIYDRYLSEFLLPDQVDILAKSLQKDIEKKLTLTDVSQQSELLFCGGCGNKRQLIVETDINSQRVCKNKLCKQNNRG